MPCWSDCFLIRATAGSGSPPSNVVDFYQTVVPTTATPLPTTVPVPTGSPPVPPQTSAIPHPPPPSAGFLCTSDCGACCCPGCHAVNGTCYLCAAGSFSSDCLDHLQSNCRTCPSGFFCPQGAAQPYLPSSTLAVIVACVVAVHIILSCIFIRTKHLKVKDAKLWILVVMIFGPIAWLFWWFRHRALNQPQTPGHALGSNGHPESGVLLNSVTPGCALNQPLLAEPQASAPPVDNDEAQTAKPFAAAAAAVAKPKGAHAVASAPPLDIHKKQIVTPSAAAAAAADVAAKQHGVHAGGRVVEPAVYDHQRPGVLAYQAPNYDDISADMTDQCLPFLLHFPPLLPPTSYRHLPPPLPSVSLTQFTCGPQLFPLSSLRCTSIVCVTQWVARYFTMEVMSDPVMACDGFT